MPQCNIETYHPTPASPEDGYALLATAVLTSLVHALEDGGPKQRQEARAAVHAHVQDLWLALLDLGEEPRARVEQLLWELAG